MIKIRRIYNQNKRGIWITILIIASFIIGLQLLNYFAKRKSESNLQMLNVLNRNTVNNETEIDNNVIINKNKPIISDEGKSDKIIDEETNTIKNFLKFCNNGQISEAYDMLTEECKEEMYKDEETFKKLYCLKVFKEDKKYYVEAWSGNTYRVTIQQDLLSNGGKKQNSVQDYITLKKEDEVYKLNINNYIGREKIEKTTEKNDITIQILSKDIYIDFEKYNIKIKNNSSHTVLMDTLKNVNGMYIENSQGAKFTSYLQELTTADLEISMGYEKYISIKYYSAYSEDKDIKKLVFSDIVLNYEVKSEEAFNKVEIKAEV